MIRRIWNWLGPAGRPLAAIMLLCGVGTLGAVLTAPLGPIPLVGLITMLFLPFPTGLIYSAAALVLCLVLRLVGGWFLAKGRRLDVGAGLLAVVAVLGAGWAVPSQLNAAAGIGNGSVAPITPVALPDGGRVALISEGTTHQWVGCQSFCIALLLSGKLASVDIALSEAVPAPLVKLQGWRITPRGPRGSESRTCLNGRRDYSGIIRRERELRRADFKRGSSIIWDHYIEPCFDVVPVEVDPAAQLTLVNYSRRDLEGRDDRNGLNDDIELRRIVAPRAGTAPLVREAVGRTGQGYAVPLMVWPFGGNAASGGTFTPSLWQTRTMTMAYEWEVDANWWPMVEGGDALLNRAVDDLDALVASR
jgi:hypothetical protein